MILQLQNRILTYLGIEAPQGRLFVGAVLRDFNYVH